MIGLLRRIFLRSSMDDDVREELESHIAMRAEQNQESGMYEEEALGAAQRQFGNPTFIREQIYEFNSFALLDAAGKDLRYAFRGLRRNPGLSLTIALTIAIGVGTVTSMFGLMRDLLLAPPPHVSMPDRVFRLHQWFPGERQGESSVHAKTSYPFYELLADRAKSIEAVATYADSEDLAAEADPAHAWRARLWSQPVIGEHWERSRCWVGSSQTKRRTPPRARVSLFWDTAFGGANSVVAPMRLDVR